MSWHPVRDASTPYEPIVARGPVWHGWPRRRDLVIGTGIGALLVLFGLFTVGEAIYLDATGRTVEAEVVEVRHRRSTSVRVQVADPVSREVDLWVWNGDPQVGDTMTIVYNDKLGLAKQAGTFAPQPPLWLAGGTGFTFLAAATMGYWWRRTERRSNPVDRDRASGPERRRPGT